MRMRRIPKSGESESAVEAAEEEDRAGQPGEGVVVELVVEGQVDQGVERVRNPYHAVRLTCNQQLLLLLTTKVTVGDSATWNYTG